MFTVMICGKKFYTSVHENHSHILDLISQNDACAMLTFKPDVDTLEEAVPGLDELTAGQVEWRAIIVEDADTFGFDYINRQNPFDVVDALPACYHFDEMQIYDLMDQYQFLQKKVDQEQDKTLSKKLKEEESCLRAQIEALIAASGAKIQAFRHRKKENYSKACTSPLTRLAIWMLGAPIQEEPIPSKAWAKNLLEDECPVDWAYYEQVRDCFTLPTEIEQFRAYLEKYRILKENFLSGSLLQKLPSEVLVISERNLRRADDIFDQMNHAREELEYDNFCDDNLYPAGLRYIVYDVEYQNRRRTSKSHLGFASFAYMMAVNSLPDNSLAADRVYNGSIKINEPKARDFFTRYLRKLEATKKMLLKRAMQYTCVAPEDELPREEAMEVFEKDVTISVETRLTIQEEELLAKYKIGLSRDCPVDEETSWKPQMVEITKKFIRFLREPRRALKSAVKKDFKQKSVIEDERIFRLSEDSLEDIEFRVQEKEQQMVEIVTNRLFKTKEYTDRIDAADEAVREQIAKRMTVKKTLCIGVIALFGYLLGFIPLFVGNMNNAKKLTTTLIVTGISLGLLLLVGLIFLFVVRWRHKKHFAHFNREMQSIYKEILDGLQQFSLYLGKMCDAMRGISVFNYLKKPTDQTPLILRKHLYDVQLRIDGINGLFVSVMQADKKSDEIPYNYDFTKLCEYPYDVPYDEVESSVMFIAEDNFVSVPIDYVEQVTLRREELYD